VGLASENIGLWQPEHGYYVGNPANWHAMKYRS
jgi:hypothetical protein